MIEPEFNLLDEPWIRVRRPDCSVEEVSLKTLFAHAHEYEDLAGETPAQDLAMLRLLLAVLHCVFSRKNEKGEDRPLSLDVLKSKALREEAIRRWGALWGLRRFPYEPIDEYLEQWRHRFWLFHEERPFWQMASVRDEILRGKLACSEAKSKEKKEKGEDDKKKSKNSSKKTTEDTLTPNALSKLNGEISQSANKDRLFNVRSGDVKEELSYSEAARWLVNINAWDDNAVKKANSKDNLPSPGVGWLGKLGSIVGLGGNLFETLLLNLVLLRDGEEPWTEAENPIWEKERFSFRERISKASPDNASEILTWQSRRLLLKQIEGKITGFWILSGDFVGDKEGKAKNDVLAEQMTVWQEKKSKTVTSSYSFKVHDKNRQMWREFGSLFCKEVNTHLPGIVRWNEQVYRELEIRDIQKCSYRIISMHYDESQRSSIQDLYWDQLSFSRRILTDCVEKSNKTWANEITDAVRYCEKIAEEIGNLNRELRLAHAGLKREQKSEDKEKGAGKSKETKSKSVNDTKDTMVELYYARLDLPFRYWLNSIEPNDRSREQQHKIQDWRKHARGLAIALGKEMVRNAGPSAFMGRWQGEGDKKVYYDASQAFNRFLMRIFQL